MDDDEEAVFAALLRALYNDRVGCGDHYFVVGLHERDPLAPVLSEYRSIPAAGRLFVVKFGESPVALDGRVPYVEMAFV